jgi:hypothetical protein
VLSPTSKGWQGRQRVATAHKSHFIQPTSPSSPISQASIR